MSKFILFIGTCLSLYVGLYLMFLKSVVHLFLCFQSSSLTSPIITYDFLKILGSSFIAYFIFIVFYFLSIVYKEWRMK